MADLGAFTGAAARAAREGLSANAALKRLREAGLGIRRADFLRAYRDLRGALESQYSLLGLPLAGRPSQDMIRTVGNAKRDGFHHVVNMMYRSRDTGDVVTRRTTVVSHTLLTKIEAEEAAMGLHVAGGYSQGAPLIGISLESVKHFSTGTEGV